MKPEASARTASVQGRYIQIFSSRHPLPSGKIRNETILASFFSSTQRYGISLKPEQIHKYNLSLLAFLLPLAEKALILPYFAFLAGLLFASEDFCKVHDFFHSIYASSRPTETLLFANTL